MRRQGDGGVFVRDNQGRFTPNYAPRDNAAARTRAVREAYSEVERQMFASESDAESRERITEILRLTRAQLADDSASNDRQRFGGRRTLSLDHFAEEGFEPSEPELPSRMVREEQEALEYGMKPDIDKLTMEQGDVARAIFRYGFSYREAARRLGITTPAVQRRVKRALHMLLRAGTWRYGRFARRCTEHGGGS